MNTINYQKSKLNELNIDNKENIGMCNTAGKFDSYVVVMPVPV